MCEEIAHLFEVFDNAAAISGTRIGNVISSKFGEETTVHSDAPSRLTEKVGRSSGFGAATASPDFSRP